MISELLMIDGVFPSMQRSGNSANLSIFDFLPHIFSDGFRCSWGEIQLLEAIGFLLVASDVAVSLPFILSKELEGKSAFRDL